MSSLFETQELKGFIRVTHTARFESIFQLLYSMQSDVLYAHSRIYPFAYLNVGRLKLFVNEDVNSHDTVKIIPVVKKFDSTPTFFLHAPVAEVEDILRVVDQLTPLSKQPVKICDVTTSYAEWFLSQAKGWHKVKTSDDIIQDAKVLSEIKGRTYSSLRNTLKHVREDLKPEIRVLSPDNYKDAIKVFEDWKESEHAKKFFRLTIGRDVRLIETFYDKIDCENYFAYIYYVEGKPCACSFGTSAIGRIGWGQDITCKADTTKRGLADFAFIHLMQEMHKKGIQFVNDSGYYSPGVRKNKEKFAPVLLIQMFDLVKN